MNIIILNDYDAIRTSVEEPLFLNPDGTRTRFPIGWEGKGRYIPGSLRLYRNSDNSLIDPATYGEENNGIFFNFTSAPAVGSYEDITVRYLVRPEDYAFSQGTSDSAYPGEEYFLFPNWNNAKGCGDAFWVGKYAASNESDIPVSKNGKVSWAYTRWDTQVASCLAKGDGFHCIRNREYVSIALWTDEMGITVYGNFNGYHTGGTNIDMRGIGTNITSDMADTSDSYHKILTGTGPDTFRHNGKPGGISDLGGNVWEAVDGLQLRNGIVYVLDENNTDYVSLGSDVLSTSTSNPMILSMINNSTNDLLNEGLVVDTDGRTVTSDHPGGFWQNRSGTRICYRGGSCIDGSSAGVWALGLDLDISRSYWYVGFRLARAL